MAAKKQPLVVLEPKNDAAREKLEYHGLVWQYRGESETKYQRNKGLCIIARSLDGKKVLFISKENDIDYGYRMR